jgi:hypothetical protein
MPPKLHQYKVGDTRPAIDGTFVGVDLTGATVVCAIENTADGTSPFGDTTATIVSATARRTKVRYNPPAGWAAGSYIGWFVATLDGQIHRTPAFTVRVGAVDRTPVAGSHPAIYRDGRGGYATAADVMLLMRNRDGFSDKTNDDLIEELLGDTAVELDSALSQMYETPIQADDSPKAYQYVRLIHKYWALAALHDLLIPVDPDGNGKAAVVYRDKGAQMIDDLVEGTVVLADAVGTDSRPIEHAGAGATIAAILDADDLLDGSHPIFSIDHFSRRGRGF